MRNEGSPHEVDNQGFFELSNCYDELNEKNRLLGWNVEYRQLKPMEYRGGMAGLETHDATLLIEDVDVPSEVVGEFHGGVVWIMLGFSLADESIHVLGNDFGGSSAFLLNLGGEVDVITAPETRLAHFCMDASDFNLTWESLAPGINPFQFGYFGFIDVHSGCSPAFYRDVSCMLRGDYSRGVDREEYVSTVLAMLALQATSGSPIHNYRPRAAVRMRVRSRAREFIESNKHGSIRLSELCAYAGASMSTLTRVFREYYGMAPAAYIRWCRMYDSFEFLRQSDPQETSVGDIIRACGIRHPGRFASEYRQFFGESPKQTLGYRAS